MGRVSDILADGVGRAGAVRAFVAAGAPSSLVEAIARRGLSVVEAPDGAAACVLAAVTGELTDAPGVALAAMGDAAALSVGLALALRDRAPVILFTDLHVDLALLGPVIKASLVPEPALAGHWIAHAANLALTEPRGTMHVACAADVLEAASLPVATACRPAALPAPAAERLDAFASALAATRPIVVTGRECTGDDAGWVRAFAETLPAPVLATPKGRGTLPEPHPLALGLLAAGHPLLARADLALLVGVDPSELPPGVLPPALPLARVGRAPWPAGAQSLAAEVTADIALVIEELAPRVKARPAADWDVAALDRVKRALAADAVATPAARLVRVAREATPAGTMATADVPLGLAWQAVAPRETLTALGGHAPAGYAVLAAIAAQLADRDRRVVAFTSPFGLAASGAALALAERLALPIVVVVLDAAADESAFARDFALALGAGRPAVVGVSG
jgi:acetolactate synthase I/II/III large subunit